MPASSSNFAGSCVNDRSETTDDHVPGFALSLRLLVFFVHAPSPARAGRVALFGASCVSYQRPLQSHLGREQDLVSQTVPELTVPTS